MTSSRRLALAVSGALAAIVAAPALAAYVCHHDPPGTRTLAISGSVAGYVVHGPHVSVAVRSSGACKVLAWNALTGLHAATSRSCTSVIRRSLQSSRSVERIAGWPLPARPRTVNVSSRYAVFAGRDGGTYVLRLRDGRTASLGAGVVGDVPQVNRLGVVFAARPAYSSREGVMLEFVPTSGLEFTLRQNARPLHTGGAIESLSMDGPRVALAVRDRSGRCDRVLYWNVLRAPVQRISAPAGPTCATGPSTTIPAVAMGGFRAAWLAESGAAGAVVIGSPRCQEWVVRRLVVGHGGESVGAMAADGTTLAFEVTEHQRELRGLASVDVIAGRYSARTILTGRLQPVGIAVDGSRVATALAGGTVDVRTVGARPLASLQVGAAEAIALSGRRLVVLRSTRLDVYDLATKDRVAAVRIPRATVDAVDVQDGIAVIASGRDAIAVDLSTGAHAVVGRAAAPLLGTAIERPGVALASTSGRTGTAQFVPLARVEVLLGRA